MEDLRANTAPELEPSNSPKIAGETPMGDFRATTAAELEPSSTPKILGAVVVLLGVAALGAYTLSTGMWDSPSPRVVASAEPAPVKIAPPAAPMTPAPTPAATAPMSAPASPYGRAANTTPVTAPAPAKPATRVAHVHKSTSTVAPSVPDDVATPATAPAPDASPAPATPTPPAPNEQP
jgi:hypothetical protein